MKRHLIMLLMAILPVIGMAQGKDKYLKGAVPVENNHVTFKAEMLTEGVKKDKAFDIILTWANTRFQPGEELHARVAYTNKETGEIAINGDEYIVFKHNFLTRDWVRTHYLLIVTCQDNRCLLNMSRIRYHYNAGTEIESKFTAEEFITDKHALNKSKTRLMGDCGKFRVKTIDFKDKLFNDIAKLFAKPKETKPAEESAILVQNTAQPKAEASASKTEVATPKAEVATPKAVIATPKTETAAPAPKATTNDASLTNAARIMLTANGETIELGKDAWGGIQDLFGKKVASCLIDSQKKLSNLLMEQAKDYTLSFYGKDNNTPIKVIKCRMQMNKTLPGNEAKQLNVNCNENISYKMYIGEVIK